MTCAKTRTECIITTPGGVHVAGTNRCLNPQPVCPRAPGEGYEKCKTICRQVGHAEVDAVNRASALGVDLTGATAVLRGHTYMCQSCQEALYGAGVRWLGREDWPPVKKPDEKPDENAGWDIGSDYPPPGTR